MLTDLNFLEALSAVWKIFATAGFVILIGRLAWSAGPLLTSILIALPVNIGPGLLLVSLTQDSRFVLESALYGLAGGAGVAAFIVGFVRTQFFKNFYLSLLIGALGWGIVTWCILKSELTIEKASSLVVLSAVSSYILLPKVKQNLGRVATPASWNFLIKRGGVAGCMITCIALAAPFTGPAVAGILLSFPTTLCITGWMLQSHYGLQFVTETYSAASRALILYFTFCFGVIFLAPVISGPAAIILSFISVAALGTLSGYLIISFRKRH